MNHVQDDKVFIVIFSGFSNFLKAIVSHFYRIANASLAEMSDQSG